MSSESLAYIDNVFICLVLTSNLLSMTHVVIQLICRIICSNLKLGDMYCANDKEQNVSFSIQETIHVSALL